MSPRVRRWTFDPQTSLAPDPDERPLRQDRLDPPPGVARLTVRVYYGAGARRRELHPGGLSDEELAFAQRVLEAETGRRERRAYQDELRRQIRLL